MSTVAFTGWETGSLDDVQFSAGTVSVVSTPTNGGVYALRSNPTTSANGYASISGLNADGSYSATVASVATSYLRVYFRYATKPASGSEELLELLGTSTLIKAALRIDSAGLLSLYDSSGTTQVAIGATALSANTWYRLGLQIGTGTGAPYELRIDGTTEFSGTSNNFRSDNGADWLVGKATNRNNQSVDFFFDDLLWSDSGFPGVGQSVLLVPNADVTTQWAEGGSIGISHFQQVDEVPHNSDGDYEFDTTSGHVDLFDFASASGAGVLAAVNSVKVVTVGKAPGTAGSYKTRLKSGATTSDTTANATGASYTAFAKLFDTDPNTSAAWTVTALDAVQAGMVNQSTNESRVTAVYVLVDFSPGQNYGTDTGTGTETGTLAASLNTSDTGVGTDVASLTKISFATDYGSGLDAATLVQMATDTGTGTDTGMFFLPGVETGLGTDVATLAVSYAVADAGVGTDTAFVLIAVAESGVGTDAATLVQRGSDSGTGSETGFPTKKAVEFPTATETASLSVSLSGADSGAGSDTGTLSVILPATTDTGTGTEVATLAVVLSAADAGTGSETATPAHAAQEFATGTEVATVTASLTATDTGRGTDTGTLTAVLPTASDSGVGTETATLSYLVLATDSGTGTDTLAAASRAAADFGIGTEVATLTILASDSGVGTEFASPAVASDSGVGTDIALLRIFAVESGTGTETTAFTVALSGVDAGVGIETGALAASASAVDSGTGTETVSTTRILFGTDSGVGTDGASLAGVLLTAVDSGVGTETGTAPLAAFLTASDSGVGTETATRRPPLTEVTQ